MGEKSQSHTLKCRVPQGSTLGLKLFTIYTHPIGDIIHKHNAKFHLYEDDTQLYLPCQHPSDPIALKETLTKLETCIDNICQWMPLNRSKLNDGKTKFLVLQSKNISHLEAPNIHIGIDNIGPGSTAQNVGVIIDSTLSMCLHVTAVCKAATFQLHRISHIHQFLTTDATKTPVHSLILSRVDYYDFALASLPDSEINKLPCIRNAMAHLTSCCS